MKKNIRRYSCHSLLRVNPSLSFKYFFRSILENWTLFGPISSDTGHLKSYKYSYITNIIDSWYKSIVIINLFMFTIDIWIDTFLQSYSNTHQSYQVLRMTSYHRISTNPLMRDSLTSIFAEQYIKSLLKNTSTTLLVERYESCFLFTFLLFIFWERLSRYFFL